LGITKFQIADLRLQIGWEATLLREALDDLLKKYNDQLGKPPKNSNGV